MFSLSPSSRLFNHSTFYVAFERDLLRAKQEVIIESPFITERRMQILMPIFQKLARRGVKLIINTRHPDEHSGEYIQQATDWIAELQEVGATVLYTGQLHRKLAIIDRRVLYEGSLNILSYGDSCEIMRRVASVKETERLLDYIGIKKYV